MRQRKPAETTERVFGHSLQRNAIVTMLERKAAFLARYCKNQEISTLKWVRDANLELSKVVLQVPARSGSSRVRDKNIAQIDGHPLLAYTARIATRLKGVDRVIINTDSRRYADIAERYGMEAPFLRPKDLARVDMSLSWVGYYAVRHFIDHDYPIKALITLLPTSLFRNLKRIQCMTDMMIEHGSVQTAFRANTMNAGYMNAEGEPLIRAADEPCENTCFKQLGTYHGEYIIKKHISKSILYFINDPIELIDIDVDEDIEVARYIVENNLYDFGI